jgi:hypothetical protein
VTVFRPIAPAAAIRAAAADQRRQLATSLLALQTPDGLFAFRMSGTREGDSWTSAQLLATLACTPEIDRTVASKMMAAFDTLFRAYVVKDDRGIVGFLFERGHPPHGVVALWMVSALARTLTRPTLFDEGERQHLLGLYRIAVASADQLAPLQDGGWNMYPSQDDPAAHNAYSTALALRALLDVRAAGLPWTQLRTVDQMILRASAWLTANFSDTGLVAGWPGAPANVVEIEAHVLDGLSLQTFSTLLRAEAEAGVVLPVGLVDLMTSRLIGAGERAPDFPTDASDFPIRVAGKFEKEGIHFTWSPWTLEASIHWLERAERTGAAPAKIQAVRRTVSRIVTGHDRDFFRYALGKERYTYEATELLLALSRLRP